MYCMLTPIKKIRQKTIQDADTSIILLATKVLPPPPKKKIAQISKVQLN